MKTLTIKDLARADELGRDAMAAVRGGYTMSAPTPSYALRPMPPAHTPSGDSSIHIDQKKHPTSTLAQTIQTPNQPSLVYAWA